MEVTEADICQRFGWTFTELDEQDQDRVFASFMLQNLRDSANRIKQWLEHSGKDQISEHDLEIYEMLSKAMREVEDAA